LVLRIAGRWGINLYKLRDGPRGTRPYRGNKGISLKDHSSSKAEQNVTKFGMKHHWGRGINFILTKVMAPEARGASPYR